MSNDMARRLMERVKRLRESLGLTQEAFAERAGLKYKHYQAVEAGRKTNIQFETLIKMARACGLEPWQLLRFEDGHVAFSEEQAAYDAGWRGSGAKKRAAPASRKTLSKRRREPT